MGTKAYQNGSEVEENESNDSTRSAQIDHSGSLIPAQVLPIAAIAGQINGS